MNKLGVQMYSFWEGEEYDTREILKKASELGFTGVELFGPNYKIPAEEMKSYLAELHLEVISLHAQNSCNVEELIPYAAGIGSEFLGIGSDVMRNEEEVHAYAKRLNMLGEKCHANGLMLTYHNHTQEFIRYQGKTVMDILAEETNPEWVSIELDAGWCAAAGEDPAAFVQKHSGRVKLIHIKESSKVIGPQPPMDPEKLPRDENGNIIFSKEMHEAMEAVKKINCAAGEGLVDWKRLRETADAHGCKAYIVEREYSASGTRLETLQKDVAYYKENC